MSRPLTPGEVRLARSVFGDRIDYGRVRICGGGPGRTAITLGSRIHFPSPAPNDASAGALPLQAWFVHEMTHVLQFQSAPLRTLWSWFVTLASGGYHRARGYRYAMPLAHWGAYNLEQQASMVEHAFVLREQGACAAAPEGASLAAYRACVPFLD